MTTVMRTESALERFSELRWLDALISFIFRLLAKLAELFLAFGLIASAIDYGSHGEFLGAHQTLMNAWMITQGLALEGSGGTALAMSFDAQAQQDCAKAWMQRCLALSLLTVGGVMFFVELIASAKGFKESSMPDWYIYGMAGLRALVSLGYIAMCRTKDHRFSGAEPALPPIAAPNIETEVARQVGSAVGDARSHLQTTIDALRTAVEGSLAEIPSMIHAAAQSMPFEVDPAQLSVQVSAIVDQAVLDLDLTAHIDAHIDQAIAQAMRGHAQTQRATDELAQPAQSDAYTEPSLSAVSESLSARARALRYIEAQRAQGRMPESKEIAQFCGCALRTAQMYRKEILEA